MSAIEHDASRPRLQVPPGARDTHIHVYDRRYPTAKTATVTPPDEAMLLNVLLDWLDSDGARQLALVDNPARLYGF